MNYMAYNETHTPMKGTTMIPVAALGAVAFGASSIGGSFLGTKIVQKVLPSKAPTYSTSQSTPFELYMELERLFPKK